MLQDIVDKIFFLVKGGADQEKKLMRCQGYRPNSIVRWKRQNGLGWTINFKILRGLKVFCSVKIRKIISEIVRSNAGLFSQKSFFITSFGSEGKSGGMICYEFRHSKLVDATRFVKSSDIAKLPLNSTIIFVDDLVSTGTQSLDYINDKLNLLLSPSHSAILLTICATPNGIKKIRENSNFKVLTGVTIQEERYQYYSTKCHYFDDVEKRAIKELNSKLKDPAKQDYDRGFLIAFYYSVPNNTMPIIWKDNYKYVTKDGGTSTWFALLPRQIFL